MEVAKVHQEVQQLDAPKRQTWLLEKLRRDRAEGGGRTAVYGSTGGAAVDAAGTPTSVGNAHDGR